MRLEAKWVEIILASAIIMLFGVASASNMGIAFAARRAGLLTDAEAAACLGGASCPPTGGLNCGDSSHTCSSSGCTVTTTACSWTGSLCESLNSLAGASTFPCQTYFVGGKCYAYAQGQCIKEMYGQGSGTFPCNWFGGYCNTSGACGEVLYLQKSS